MKRLNLLLTVCLTLIAAVSLNAKPQELYSSEDWANASKIVEKMSLEQKLNFLGGSRTSMGTQAIEGSDVGKVYFADSTTGVRGHSGTTAYPCAITMAATWNKELVAEVGKAIGLEAADKGIGVVLGPGMNIYRVPQNGRNFEYFGEDPYLVSILTTEYIKAMQSVGVIATAKHFVGNNQDYDRHRRDSQISERALHEIYFPAFKSAVQKGGVRAIMTAYNGVNGFHASESTYLLTDILRKSWGYNGIIMSDWSSTYSDLPLYKAGMDLEMPWGKWLNADNLKKYFVSGELDESELDFRITRMVAVLLGSGVFDSQKIKTDYAKNNETARNIAREGIVLLKNSNNILPLKSSEIKSIAVIGPNALNTPVSGGGAAYLKGNKEDSIFSAMKKSGESRNISVNYYQTCVQETVGYYHRMDRKWRAGRHPGTWERSIGKNQNKINNGKNLPFTGNQDSILFKKYRQTNIEKAAANDVVVICVGFTSRYETESRDRTFALFEEQSQLIREVAALNKNVIVVVNAGGGVEMSRWIESPKAVLHSWYLGQNSGVPVAEIIFGDINPSGKLPISIEQKWEDNCAFGSYDTSFVDPFGCKFPYNSYAWKKFDLVPEPYPEGIFTGYRHLDKNNIIPQFPFGFGLSYTTFEYSDMKLSSRSIEKGQSLELSFTVTNTGTVAGKETVQLYISDVESSLPRPVRELKGFAKVNLQPGESRSVSLIISPEDLQFYDDKIHQWVAECGKFTASIGASSRDIRLSADFELK